MVGTGAALAAEGPLDAGNHVILPDRPGRPPPRGTLTGGAEH